MFPIDLSYAYADTYKDLKNYTAILGDSHAFGLSDSYLENKYSYSVGHYLFNFFDYKYNFANFGVPGAGSELILEKFKLSLKRIKQKPDKIIYFARLPFVLDIGFQLKSIGSRFVFFDFGFQSG